jgi:hypothetical protein
MYLTVQFGIWIVQFSVISGMQPINNIPKWYVKKKSLRIAALDNIITLYFDNS